MTRPEMHQFGWRELDILLITGDAYVDHPAFGVPLLGRWLQSHGYRVGIVAQPRWKNVEDIAAMGRPRLFAGITAGALDSMLAHYTAFRKKRHQDAYSPGGKIGMRPNRATIVYTNLVRQAFPDLPVVIGGIEASLRRASHYDFWSDKIRRSILLDSKADLLIWGMAEKAILEVAKRLNEGEPLHGINGTAFITKKNKVEQNPESLRMPSHEEITDGPNQLMTATLLMERHCHTGISSLFQTAGERALCFAPPMPPLTQNEMDKLYALPFSRKPHPLYKEKIPALEPVQFSITAHRGCGGGCTFCSLAIHQGRTISSRSIVSVLEEASSFKEHGEWKGSISDIGGPTANLWGSYCLEKIEKCERPSCLVPRICKKLKLSQKNYTELLSQVANLPHVKHVRIASGIRHDIAILEKDCLRQWIREFIGGQLKVAPEHVADPILKHMRKPSLENFERFLDFFYEKTREAKKEQYVLPYFISAFPGCSREKMQNLADWLKRRNWKPQQVQCFIPTPGTVATAMYHAEIDSKGNPISVAKSDAERLAQHGMLFPKK